MLAFFLPLAAYAAEPVGWWTFEGESPLLDRSGHWAEVELSGTARLSEGALELRGKTSGSSSTAVGWAGARGYTGPALASKTQVVWLRLVQPQVRGGAAMSVDSLDGSGVFDAIVWAELRPRRWEAGSNYYSRSQTVPQADETGTGVVQLARADRVDGDAVWVTLCRGATVLGTYRDGPAGRWAPENAVIRFGQRHTSANVENTGGLSADLLEARLYSEALTCAQVGALAMVR